MGDSQLGPGCAEGVCGEARWSLRFASGEPELRHLPRGFLYRAPLPRTKLTSPAPAARFEGVLELPNPPAAHSAAAPLSPAPPDSTSSPAPRPRHPRHALWPRHPRQAPGLDILATPSGLDILARPPGLDILATPSGLDILARPPGLDILTLALLPTVALRVAVAHDRARRLAGDGRAQLGL